MSDAGLIAPIRLVVGRNRGRGMAHGGG
jgi:hypothetical protein